MVRKLVVSALAVALFAVNSSAQFYPENARIKALGGSFIVDDPSYILRYSAYINQYTNDAQINFNTADSTTGGHFNSPIWGVKSFGKTFNLGVLANQKLMIDNANFYNTSGTLSSINAGNGLVTTQNIPHILLGFNLSAVKLGADLFYEYSHYKADISDKPSPATSTSTDTSIRGNVNNLGFIASALFGKKTLPISVKFGMGFPVISGKREITTTPNATGVSTTVTTEVKSKKGLFLNGGAELGFTTAKLNWKTGADYIFNHFQFQDNTGTTLNNNFFNNLAAYIGFNADIDRNSFVTLLYDFQFRNNGNGPNTQTYTSRTTSTNLLSNIISAGYENAWTKAWIFDKFVARAGLNYVISSRVEHIDGDGAGGSYSSRIKNETVYNQIDPRVGLGIVKKTFGLDVTIHPAAWSGLISGPAVGEVTATLIF